MPFEKGPCSVLNCSVLPAFAYFQTRQLSWRVPNPLSSRISWTVIDDTRQPGNLPLRRGGHRRGRMVQRQLLDPRRRLRCRRLEMAVVMRWQVLQTSESLGLRPLSIRLVGQLPQRLAGKATDGPLVHRDGSGAAVGGLRQLLPVQDRPLEPAAAAGDRDAVEVRENALAVAVSAVRRADVEVLQVQTGARARKVEKVWK